MEIVNAERQRLISKLVTNIKPGKEQQEAIKWLNQEKLPKLRQLVSILPQPVANQNRYGGLPTQYQSSLPNYIGQGGGPPPVTNKSGDDDDALPILTMNEFIKEEEAKNKSSRANEATA
jgi:hypothetical protein